MKYFGFRKQRKRPSINNIDSLLGLPRGTVIQKSKGDEIWFEYPNNLPDFTPQQKTTIKNLLSNTTPNTVQYEEIE